MRLAVPPPQPKTPVRSTRPTTLPIHRGGSPSVIIRSIERFAEHLSEAAGLDRTPPDDFHGAAGGSVCGDLIRVSVSVDGATVRAGFEAEGCGALTAAGSALVTLVAASRCSTPPAWACARSRPSWRALAGQAPCGRARRGRAAPALGAAARRAARGADPARTLVAMSGGVDSAVAALLVARTREAVAVTLELWADPANDAECVVLLGGRGARRTRARPPDGHGAPHARPARRVPRRRGGPVPERPRRGGDAEPVRQLQRPRAPGRDARPRRPPRRRRPGHRPLRARDRGRAAAHGRRSGQGPGVHALGAQAGLAGAHALPAGRPDQARGARAGRRGRAAGGDRRTRRTSASWPAPARAAFLARHGGLADAPGRDRRRGGARARPPPRPPPLHRRPAPGPRRRAPPSRSTCCARTPAPTASSSARATRWPRARCASAARGCTVPAAEVDARAAALPLAAVPCRSRRATAPAASWLPSPFDGAAPGQTAVPAATATSSSAGARSPPNCTA